MEIFVSSKSDNNLIKTYTEYLNSIPDEATKEKNLNWRKEKLVEFRWRFYKFNDKRCLEISYIKFDEEYRTFLNKNNEWVVKEKEPFYPDNIIEEYYHYCKN